MSYVTWPIFKKKRVSLMSVDNKLECFDRASFLANIYESTLDNA
jgi:hypothetical protein